MRKLFLIASLLACAFSCTEQEEIASNAANPEQIWISVEDRYTSAKQSSNGRIQEENPLDPFEFLCLSDPPSICCDQRPFGAVLTWSSPTHSFESGSPYRFAYDGPSGKSNYRITATAGQELTYSMRIDGTNSDQAVRMTIVPTDGAYASMETSYGTVVYDPANGGEQWLSLHSAYADRRATMHTFTIPKNPYANRELKVKIDAGWVWFTTAPENCVYGLPLNTSRFPGFYISDLNDRPWVEITLPPTPANITYLGSSSMPGNGASDGGGITVVTPPASMQIGDLVVLYGVARDGGATIAQYQLGGQTWNALPNMSGAPRNVSSRAFWCRFNGTWTANPSLNITANNAPRSAILHVFRPTTQSKQWGVDVALTSSLHSVLYTPYTATINGVTTVNSSTVTIASWAGEGIRWFSGAPAGWTNLGPTEYKNIGGSDTSTAFRYKIKNTADATGNVSSTLTGQLHTVRSIVSFYEY